MEKHKSGGMGMTPNEAVNNAIAILGQGLDAHIRKVMDPIIGGTEWPVVLRELDVNRGKVGYEYQSHDVALQLRMVTERLGAIGFPFDKGDRNRTMSCYGGILRIFRKRWAHNDEFSHFDATHFLDTVRIVLNHIGDGQRSGDVAAVHASLVDDLVKEDAEPAVALDVHAVDVSKAVDSDGCHDSYIPGELHCDVFIDPPSFPTFGQLSPATHETRWEPWDVSLMGDPDTLDRLRTKDSQQKVRAVVEDIVDAEAPIHIERLAKLVGYAFGLKRVGKDRVKSIVHQVGKSSVFRDDFGFVWPENVEPQKWLLYRSCAEGERDFDEVSPIELANAIVAELTGKGDAALDDLRYAVLNAFGRKKVTKNSRLQFGKGLAQAREFGRVVEDGGVISLAEVAGSGAGLAAV
ncbi:DUF3320 domain-containing protein [Arthrobacter sp. SDTb3-6]|uniref:DUF3320 domain-containing protein n=1 Tax=Arthrobacter sp. SDTb3-6 TaxID=2713571 RepID=UPI00159D6B3F|nr:DUF3320 domain-containing protein [Arthrobacter sp. SDTb3-6]NVN00143.1 DUF3320 domain-containing protein [Arthrobacter sp. SDTb3-6]